MLLRLDGANAMPGNDNEFLSLTFDGGRFAATHSVPVEVLRELATMEELIKKVARHLYLEDTDRERVRSGFYEAATLYLATSEAKCFSAKLAVPKADEEARALLERARDLVIAAVIAVAVGGALPATFPPVALDKLAALGQRLTGDESLTIKQFNATAPSARIDQGSRVRLAEMIKRPLRKVETVEGEVHKIDHSGRLAIQTPNGDKVEMSFDETQRQDVGRAFLLRPIARINAHGLLIYSTPRKMIDIDQFEVVLDERAPEVNALWTRLDQFKEMPAGWLDGHSPALSELALASARGVLARLLVERPDIEKPGIFPTPDGGVQAEWILDRWAADVRINPEDGSIEAEATHADSGAELSASFSSDEVSADMVDPLASWIVSIKNGG